MREPATLESEVTLHEALQNICMFQPMLNGVPLIRVWVWTSFRGARAYEMIRAPRDREQAIVRRVVTGHRVGSITQWEEDRVRSYPPMTNVEVRDCTLPIEEGKALLEPLVSQALPLRSRRHSVAMARRPRSPSE